MLFIFGDFDINMEFEQHTTTTTITFKRKLKQQHSNESFNNIIRQARAIGIEIYSNSQLVRECCVLHFIL